MDRRRVDWSICWLDHIGYTIQWLGGLSVGKLVMRSTKGAKLMGQTNVTLPLPLHIAHPSTKSSQLAPPRFRFHTFGDLTMRVFAFHHKLLLPTVWFRIYQILYLKHPIGLDEAKRPASHPSSLELCVFHHVDLNYMGCQVDVLSELLACDLNPGPLPLTWCSNSQPLRGWKVSESRLRTSCTNNKYLGIACI